MTDRILQVQKSSEKDLLKKSNVVSVGKGFKHTKSEKTDEVCLVVGVTKKVDKTQLTKRDLLPKDIEGVKIDVIEMGNIKALIDPTEKHRPAIPGTSIGHKNITAGTFGCVVQRQGEKLLLSNNHVLANSNDAEIGDEIFQPGPIDGGSTADRMGFLEDFIPINFGGSGGGGGNPPPVQPPTCPIAKLAAGSLNMFAAALGRKHRLQAVKQAEPNLVDAALCRPTEPFVEEIAEIGKPTGTKMAELGMAVQKYGRTTAYTTGTVLQIGATVSVQYGPGQIATFSDQVVTGPMSQGGDSGSVVLDMEGNVVGLLFAGSTSTMIFSHIHHVFDALNITL